MTLQKRSCFFLFIDTAAAVALFSFFLKKYLKTLKFQRLYGIINLQFKDLQFSIWKKVNWGRRNCKFTVSAERITDFFLLIERKKRAFPDSPYLLSIEISIRSFRFPQEIARVSTLQQRCQDRRKLLAEISLQQTRKCCAMSCLILSHLVNSATAPLGRNVGISTFKREKL